MHFEASRPYLPGYGLAGPNEGNGLLPWLWAEERLRTSHNYWVSTITPHIRPHLMAVWGIWLDDAFFFCTGGSSRKARNLLLTPKCTIATESASEAVIVEGVGKPLTDATVPRDLAEVYQRKYDMRYPSDSLVFRITPEVVFAFIESPSQFAETATRWKAVP